MRATSEAPACVRPNPCPSCPYRLDVPSGVWSEHEYPKLVQYDGGVVEQIHAGAGALFACHSTPDLLCAGWVGHRRQPTDLLAIRLGLSAGTVDEAVAEYRTRVPLFGSGAEAAAHGLADVGQPGPEAVEAMRKVVRARAGAEAGIVDLDGRAVRPGDPIVP